MGNNTSLENENKTIVIYNNKDIKSYNEIIEKINENNELLYLKSSNCNNNLFKIENIDHDYFVSLFNPNVDDKINDSLYCEIKGIYFYCDKKYDEANEWFSKAYFSTGDNKYLAYIGYSNYMSKNYDKAIKNLQLFTNNNYSFFSVIYYIYACKELYIQTKIIKIIEDMFKQLTIIIQKFKKEDIDDIINSISYQTYHYNETFYDYYDFLRKNKKVNKCVINNLKTINKIEKEYIKLFDEVYKNKENIKICDYCDRSTLCYTDSITTINYCKCCFLSENN
jgi:hypothetical protein